METLAETEDDTIWPIPCLGEMLLHPVVTSSIQYESWNLAYPVCGNHAYE